jgi:hypothetical protein
MNLQEIQEYIHVHRPTAAYLGRLEMQAMTTEANNNGWIRPDCFLGNNDLARMEYCGCPIFEVMSESHAGFQSRENVERVHLYQRRRTSVTEFGL